MLRSEYLSQELTEALPTKGGGLLRTIQGAHDYSLALPPQRAMRKHWRDAWQLILEEAEAAEVSEQIELALFLDDELDLDRLSGARQS
jgi:hypothetical protein